MKIAFHLFRFLITLLVFSGYNLTGQTLKLEGVASFGSYAQRDFKDLMRQDQKTSPYPLKIVNDYPAYFNYTARFRIGFNKFSFGHNFKLMSSGAKLHYRDYSGEVM